MQHTFLSNSFMQIANPVPEDTKICYFQRYQYLASIMRYFLQRPINLEMREVVCILNTNVGYSIDINPFKEQDSFQFYKIVV